MYAVSREEEEMKFNGVSKLIAVPINPSTGEIMDKPIEITKKRSTKHLSYGRVKYRVEVVKWLN